MKEEETTPGKKTQSKLDNSISEIKKKREGMNNRLSGSEEHTQDLGDRVMEIT